MQRKYAIVHPSYSFVGDGLADLPYLFIAPYHWLTYERICGYSLGHQPAFYNSLDDAKRDCSRQDAVIEFDVDLEANEISGLQNIYTILKMQKLIREVENGEANDSGYKGKFFEKCKVPVWESRQINQNDLTAHALDTLNESFQAQNIEHRTGIVRF